MSWDIFPKAKIQYFLQKLKDKFVQKETGKGLSTNDYTTAEKTKLAGISTNANKTESSTTNGNIKIDNVETPIYRNYANNTVLTTDKTPYLNRQCLTPTGFSSYVREKLIGCSVAWNQLVQNGNFADSTGWSFYRGTTAISGNVVTMTVSGAAPYALHDVNIISGHKYLVCGDVKQDESGNMSVYPLLADHAGTQVTVTTVGSWVHFAGIWQANSTKTSYFVFDFSNKASGNKIYMRNAYIIDLTLAFGSTVADTLYAMTNNGGIDWLRNHNYPTDQYTQYGYGLYSTKPSAKKVVGFNVWDGTYETGKAIRSEDGLIAETGGALCISDYIPIVGGLNYYLLVKGIGSGGYGFAWYDSGKNYISGTMSSGGSSTVIGVVTSPSNARYIRFTYNSSYDGVSSICINISDTNKNGQYEPYSETTYSLGSTELRGHLIVQNGEIVAEGDVRESNGEVTRKWKEIDLGTLDWTYSTSVGTLPFFYASYSQTLIEGMKGICTKYVFSNSLNDFVWYDSDKTIAVGFTILPNCIHIHDSAYTDAATFKTAMSGVYALCELATPTTETSSSFADPMSLNGCTTEEYVDDRTIPVPVGHETQYMGQSEDIVEIPSSPLSDGKRVLVAETSGGNTQYYFEDDKNGAGTQVNLMTYDTSSNKYVFPSDGYITLSNAGATVGDYIILSVFGANDNTICGLRCDTPIASMVTVQNLFVKRGMKCYIRAKSTGSFLALFTPLS